MECGLKTGQVMSEMLLCSVDNRYSDDEISRKVSVYRQMLMDNLENATSAGGSGAAAVETDEAGRPVYVKLLQSVIV